MIAGHLQQKKGYWYIVLNVPNESGRHSPKWFSTGLKVKGNKGKAEELLIMKRIEYSKAEERQHELINPPILDQSYKSPGTNQYNRNGKGEDAPERTTGKNGIQFVDWMNHWLQHKKNRIALTTYAGYQNIVENKIIPYFKPRNLKLDELSIDDLDDFYDYMMIQEHKSHNTIKRYHANIHSALKMAVQKRKIDFNVADYVELPTGTNYEASFYSIDEANQLLHSVKGEKIEFAVFMAMVYGLRRSEVIGLKWNAINMDHGCIEIKHTVTTAHIDGQQLIIAENHTKTASSKRALPLIPSLIQLLARIKEKQQEMEELLGASYYKGDSEYIYLDEYGHLIKPSFVSQHFSAMLDKKGFRRIRYHDLRHSCASMLLAAGVDLKDIQAWLGHSSLVTTADLYTHLDSKRKNISATKLTSALELDKLAI